MARDALCWLARQYRILEKRLAALEAAKETNRVKISISDALAVTPRLRPDAPAFSPWAPGVWEPLGVSVYVGNVPGASAAVGSDSARGIPAPSLASTAAAQELDEVPTVETLEVPKKVEVVTITQQHAETPTYEAHAQKAQKKEEVPENEYVAISVRDQVLNDSPADFCSGVPAVEGYCDDEEEPECRLCGDRASNRIFHDGVGWRCYPHLECEVSASSSEVEVDDGCNLTVKPKADDADDLPSGADADIASHRAMLDRLIALALRAAKRSPASDQLCRLKEATGYFLRSRASASGDELVSYALVLEKLLDDVLSADSELVGPDCT